jgi:hypothetical protein
MADDRTPRSAETRVAKRRWKPASVLPDPIPKSGYGYRWVSTHLMGEAQPTNISQKLREGYEPVNVKDHPEFASEANEKGEVKIGGLMLCKMPSEMLEERKAFYEAQANSQISAVNSKFLGQSDPRMPVFTDNKSSSTRGNSFGNGNS